MKSRKSHMVNPPFIAGFSNGHIIITSPDKGEMSRKFKIFEVVEWGGAMTGIKKAGRFMNARDWLRELKG